MIAMGTNVAQPWAENPRTPNSKANMQQWYECAVLSCNFSSHNGECSNDEASMLWHANIRKQNPSPLPGVSSNTYAKVCLAGEMTERELCWRGESPLFGFCSLSTA